MKKRFQVTVKFVLKLVEDGMGNGCTPFVDLLVNNKGLNVRKHNIVSKLECLKVFTICCNEDEAVDTAKNKFYELLHGWRENILAFEMDIQPDTIMNTTNSHNKELVDKINALWASHGNPYDTDLFKCVIKALFERDIDEANGKELTHEFFERDFEGFMQMFLMNVCDDSDLQWIIDYFSKLSYEKYS